MNYYHTFLMFISIFSGTVLITTFAVIMMSGMIDR